MQYYWHTNMKKDELLMQLEQYAKREALYYRYCCNQVILRKEHLIFGCIPVNFQPSFLITLSITNLSTTIVKGRIGLPRAYYAVVSACFAAFIFLGRSLYLKNPILLVMFITVLLFILYGQRTLFVRIFNRQNEQLLVQINKILNELGIAPAASP